MVSKNNRPIIDQHLISWQESHYALRKLSVGVASVLLGTTLQIWAGYSLAHAATSASEQTTDTEQTESAAAT